MHERKAIGIAVLDRGKRNDDHSAVAASGGNGQSSEGLAVVKFLARPVVEHNAPVREISLGGALDLDLLVDVVARVVVVNFGEASFGKAHGWRDVKRPAAALSICRRYDAHVTNRERGRHASRTVDICNCAAGGVQ